MFFVGIFSMNITYIVLAIVYIFGYGTYALNQRKTSDDDFAQINVERFNIKVEPTDYTNSNCFVYSLHSCYTQQKTVVKNKQKSLSKTVDFSYKYYVFDFSFRINYNQQLPVTTRPSPIC